ncbi:prolipoprotein diacylglyceryl transferase [Paenibacillus sp. GYB004]|uniref:hypothetical protein n=1 Tax=Paenibacillus sp. GYB004 TaxID=2994393 RepID=UPI002F961898
MISWGPFAIQTGLLAVIAAALTAIAAVHLMARAAGGSNDSHAKEAAELLQNAAFIALIVWKFGHVLFAPAVVWERPSALLLLSGGTREAFVAMLVAGVYLVVRLRRRAIPIRLFLDLAAFGAVLAVIVYAAIDWNYGKPTSLPWGISLSDPEFRYHPVSVYTMLAAAFVALLLWMRRGQAGTGELYRAGSIYMGLGLLAVSFGAVPKPAVLLLSSDQWWAIALAGIGIVSSTLSHNKAEGR